ncbi:hypothetical protein HPP92_012958, partial [Vanilla planifolia]
ITFPALWHSPLTPSTALASPKALFSASSRSSMIPCFWRLRSVNLLSSMILMVISKSLRMMRLTARCLPLSFCFITTGLFCPLPSVLFSGFLYFLGNLFPCGGSLFQKLIFGSLHLIVFL